METGETGFFLALVENLSLNAETFTDKQAAALALASTEDPRAVTLLVDLLGPIGGSWPPGYDSTGPGDHWPACSAPFDKGLTSRFAKMHSPPRSAPNSHTSSGPVSVTLAENIGAPHVVN